MSLRVWLEFTSLLDQIIPSAGYYLCITKFTTSDRCHDAYLNILELMINFSSEPEVPVIIIGPEDRTVFIGTEITVTCIASGDPSPQIYILKNQIPQEIDVTFEEDG